MERLYRAAWGVKSWGRKVSLKELGFIVEVRFKHTHLAAGQSQAAGPQESPRAAGIRRDREEPSAPRARGQVGAGGAREGLERHK